MKTLLPICFLFLFIGAVNSQESSPKEMLLKVYSSDKLSQIKKESPADYRMLIYAVDHAVYKANYEGKEGDSFKTITLEGEDLPSFTELNLEILDQNQYFKINGENKLLVVKSKWVLNHELTKEER